MVMSDLLARMQAILLRHWPIAAVLIFVAPIYLAWTWTDQIGNLNSDAPAYLLMAQHYSGPPNSGGENPVAGITSAFSHFPPLYPIALARLHAATDLLRVHIVTIVFFMLALLACYSWLREMSVSPALAAMFPLLVAALPASWLLALSPQSEFLYLLCSFLALLLLAAYERRCVHGALYAAALAVAAAALTRTAGVVLLGPLLVVALRAPRRTAIGAFALALAPLVLWHFSHRSAVSYADSLRQFYGGAAPISFGEQLKAAFATLRSGLEANLAQDYRARGVVDFVGGLMLAVAIYRAGTLRPDGVYVVSYLLLMAVWPFRDEAERLLWPIVPVLIAQPVLLLAEGRRSAVPNLWLQASAVVFSAIFLALALPPISSASERFLDADGSGIPGARGMRSWYQSDPAKAARRTAGEALMIDMLRRLPSEVAPGDCVVSIRPELVNYFAGRLAAWPPPDSVPEPEFSRELHSAHCRYLFVTTASYDGYPIPLYPLQRLTEKAAVIDYGEIPPSAPGDGRIICMLVKFP